MNRRIVVFRNWKLKLTLAAGLIAVAGMLVSGCAVEKKIVREVHQGLRNPDGDVMFLYSEERTNWHGEQPGLLKCDVDGNGNPVDCQRFVISYQLRQNYAGGPERSFYVYEDPTDPSPSNRGVVRCDSMLINKGNYRPADCRQRKLTDTFDTGPTGKAAFLYTPINPARGEKDVGFFGNMKMMFGGASMENKSKQGTKGTTRYRYGHPQGIMECNVTDEGMLSQCKKRHFVFKNDNKEG
jgi:hypothetical protein